MDQLTKHQWNPIPLLRFYSWIALIHFPHGFPVVDYFEYKNVVKNLVIKYLFISKTQKPRNNKRIYSFKKLSLTL